MTRPGRALTPESARLLTLDTEPWLSCDDCFDLIDTYVEQLLDEPGRDPAPAMRAHLTGCAACYEEARSLLQLAAAERNIDPVPILPRLTAQ